MIEGNLVIKRYDPRKGEDFRVELTRKHIFSTKEHGWFAIDIYAKGKSWSKLPRPHEVLNIGSLLLQAIQQTGQSGFFSCVPPTRKAKKTLTSKFDNLHELCGSLLGYFEIEPAKIEEIFELYSQLSSSYDEWIIGSCKAQFQVPEREPKWYERAVSWDLEYLLLQQDNIGCLAYFNSETGEIIILTRLFDGLDDWVNSTLTRVPQKRK